MVCTDNERISDSQHASWERRYHSL